MAATKFVPLSDQQAIDRLWSLGHFFNPTRKEDVGSADLAGLAITDKPVKRAIRSYQNYMAEDFNRLSMEIHDRPGIADGVGGKATDRLLRVSRCGLPDYAMAFEEAGRGSWPAGCKPEHPSVHTFTVNVNKSRMPSFLNATFESAFDLCREAYANMGLLIIREDGNKDANTTATWERSNSWIGLAIVGQGQTCRTSIWSKFATGYQPRAMVDQYARLLAHEWGHNAGLRHSSGGVMNPSIRSGTFDKDEWRGDPSESKLKKFFGGEPINLDGDVPGPPPEPPTDGDGEPLSGTIAIGQHMYQLSGIGVRT